MIVRDDDLALSAVQRDAARSLRDRDCTLRSRDREIELGVGTTRLSERTQNSLGDEPTSRYSTACKHTSTVQVPPVLKRTVALGEAQTVFRSAPGSELWLVC